MSPAADLGALAERALEHAGGDAQALAVRERSLSWRFANATPTQATGLDEVEVTVLCVRDGHTGAAATTRTEEDALRNAARRAAGAAEATARAAGRPGDYPGVGTPAGGRPHAGHDPVTARLDPAAAAGAVRAAIGAAGAARASAAGLWSAGEVRRSLRATSGAALEDAVTDAYLKVVATAPSGRTGYAARAAVAAGGIDPTAVGGEAAARLDGPDPVAVPAGELPVVLGPDAVADLLHFLGFLAFNGQAYAQERSALSGRLGQQVAAPAISLSDSVRFPGTLPRAWDPEGTPKAPIPLIQDGVAHRVVHDRRSAAEAGGGAASTGHATAPGGGPAGPVPVNLVLVGGGAGDVAELAAPIRRGLFVTRLWYVNAVHEKETLLTGMTRDGTFLIEDGEISRPARDVRFTDSALRILSATEALTARARLVGLTEFYGRRDAIGAVCPALRAQGFRVTGSKPGWTV